MIALVKNFGAAVEINKTVVDDEVNNDNILVYMGMIEQRVTELTQVNNPTPKSSVSVFDKKSSTPMQLDFHVQESAL